jgi:glycine cleavage system H protein
MNVPDELLYSSDHEWIQISGHLARMGITDFAQDALGDVVYVQVPDIGVTVTNGQSFSEVESTKSVSDIYAPVSGVVIEVNAALGSDPAAVNNDPYGAGWICVIEMSDPSQTAQLIDAVSYRALTES